MRGALRRGEGGGEHGYNSAGRATNWNGRVAGDTHTWRYGPVDSLEKTVYAQSHETARGELSDEID